MEIVEECALPRCIKKPASTSKSGGGTFLFL